MVIVRKLVETAIKVSRMDKRAWDKLYFGIRTDIKLGIKHGFGAGSILGTFINDESNPFLDETPSRVGPPAYKLKKSNYRFNSSGRYRRNNKYCPPCKRRR